MATHSRSAYPALATYLPLVYPTCTHLQHALATNKTTASARMGQHEQKDKYCPSLWSCESSWVSVRCAKVVVSQHLVVDLRERKEEPQPTHSHARTSCRCPTAPRLPCETLSLMRNLPLVAPTGAQCARRRAHLEATHVLQLRLWEWHRGRRRDHGWEWPEPLDGRYRPIIVGTVMQRMGCRRPNTCQCRHHSGHHEQHEVLPRVC